MAVVAIFAPILLNLSKWSTVFDEFYKIFLTNLTLKSNVLVNLYSWI